jgi:hypothetical protein
VRRLPLTFYVGIAADEIVRFLFLIEIDVVSVDVFLLLFLSV